MSAKTPGDIKGPQARAIKDYDPDTGDPPEDLGYDAGRKDGVDHAKGAIMSFLVRRASNPFELNYSNLLNLDIREGRAGV